MAPFVIAFVAGLLTILAPCTLPLVPLVLGGASLGGSRRAVGLVVGFGGTFVVTAVVLASALATTGLTTAPLRVLAAVTLGLLGLTLAVPSLGGRVEALLAPVAGLAARLPAGGDGLIGGIGTGAAIGLLWAPCVGPVVAAALAVAVARGPTVDALAVSLAYVAGVALPLFAVATLGRRATTLAGSAASRARAQRAFGAAMTLVCLLVLTGLDMPLQSGLAAVLPDAAGLSGREPVAADGAAPLPDLGPAPELAGIAAWVGSPPLSIASLRGKVVLVHFWTFACSDCRAVQPHVKDWWSRYASAGLVVIGVHTPELSFERDAGNVRDAVRRDGVTFPVALDPSFATWNAYHNRYWPAFYFVDRSGRIRHVHEGEGDYAASEQVIRELLAEHG